MSVSRERLETALWRRLPPAWRRPLRRLLLLPLDSLDILLGRREPLVPPRGLQYHGAGDYREAGLHLVDLLTRHAGLEPGSRVLDIGCGIGRAAVALCAVLDERGGSYDGFDVAKPDIRWCRRNITRRFPHFRFQLADVGNSEYNTAGRQSAESYRFPFADGAFDVALAASVFTHLLDGGVRHYLAETARVLRPGGALLATFFLLGDEAQRRLERTGSPLRFRERRGEAFVHDPRRPEAIVAYEEGWLQRAIEDAGLHLDEPILHGTWSGLAEGASYQDVVVALRPRP